MKNKSFNLLLFIIILCSNHLFGQRIYTSNRIISSVDVMLGGDMSFRLLSVDSADPEVLQQQANRDYLEKHRISTRFGINYNHGISNNLILKAGLRIANPGFTIGSVTGFDVNAPINDVQKIFESNGTEYHYKYQIVALPIGFRYVLSKTVCEPYIEVTASPHFYRKTVVEERPYDGETQQYTITEDIKRTYFMGNLAFGGDFMISKRVSGYTQLVARYQLDRLRVHDLREKMIGLGLEAGVRCYLR